MVGEKRQSTKPGWALEVMAIKQTLPSETHLFLRAVNDKTGRAQVCSSEIFFLIGLEMDTVKSGSDPLSLLIFFLLLQIKCKNVPCSPNNDFLALWKVVKINGTQCC